MKKTLHKPIVIVGAGVAGLAAAVSLSARGHSVIVVEKEAAPGGKMRHVNVNGCVFDAGPTVMTMKWVFDELLAVCGTQLADEIGLKKSSVLARHYWSGGDGLDLYASPDQTAAAIAAFSDRKNADGYLRFCKDSKAVFETLQRSYIAASRPGPIELSRRVGFSKPGKLLGMKPFSTLWSALGSYFPDERLRQLFGRYATYCGSSPFSAPATLMLVAHVEQDGVWQVEGGMHALAEKLTDIAKRNGAEFRYGEGIEAIETQLGKVTGVVTSKSSIAADRVIYNGDISALHGLMGKAHSRDAVAAKDRSLSALVACTTATSKGKPLAHHTVFFSDAYQREFNSIFRDHRAPQDPTVYLCAQDRADDGARIHGDAPDNERIYLLMNMPANGDAAKWSKADLMANFDRCLSRLKANGVSLELENGEISLTGPNEFEALFPGSGGALYGRASHGWLASFKRPGPRTKIGGLYLAGGSVHPGPGVPMAALSGKLAAEELASDLALI